MIKKGQSGGDLTWLVSLLGHSTFGTSNSSRNKSITRQEKRTMKKLLLLLIFAPSAAFAQAVTPNFTQGSMQSTTTTTVDIERTIEQISMEVITNHGLEQM